MLTLFCGNPDAANGSGLLPSPDEAGRVRTGLEQLYRMNYATAEETFAGLPAWSPARPYFAGLACMNRFLDWGDTTALSRAEAYWESLSPRGEPSKFFREGDPDRLRLYRGLAGVQLSYAASLRGHRIRAAALALAAQKQLAPLKAPEARATVLLYDYYRGRLLEKLPFVGEAAFDAQAFTAAADESPALREMFQASLFWIHIDHGRVGAASAVAADFLERYPDSRLMRQMRADALFHAGRYAGARDEHEKLRDEYAALSKAPERLPLGYFRAVGNLARLHAALGHDREARAMLAVWSQADRTGLTPWLPRTLNRDLNRL